MSQSSELRTTNHELRDVNRGPWPVALAILSGIALCFCYPMANFGWLAWGALIPLLVAVRSAESRLSAIGLTWLASGVFFIGSLHFLTYVAVAGWFLLAFLESLFWLPLGWLLFESRRLPFLFQRILFIASAFTVFEFFRAEIPVFAFGHDLLGFSQAFYPKVIQVASVGGVYALTFLIVAVNALIGEIFVPRTTDHGPRGFFRGSWLVALATLIVGLLFTYGALRLNLLEKNAEPTLRLAVIQPNIPQSVKWAVMAKEDVIEIHENLTKIAALREPDLIIWPEASFPGYLNLDFAAQRVFDLAKNAKAGLLVGSPYWESETRVFNSALLIDKTGKTSGRYDKIKLVPFGEYVPLKFILGWLGPLAYTMGVGDFTAGDHQHLFEWQQPFPFAVLICFEDTFPEMARHAADQGAKFLAVITNDAWFGKTGAEWQHFATSIFRAVENGVPVVRSANTGISGFISAEGRVLNVVRDKKNESRFVAGELTFELPMANYHTFYRQGGWLFPYGCIALLVGLAFFWRKNEIN